MHNVYPWNCLTTTGSKRILRYLENWIVSKQKIIDEICHDVCLFCCVCDFFLIIYLSVYSEYPRRPRDRRHLLCIFKWIGIFPPCASTTNNKYINLILFREFQLRRKLEPRLVLRTGIYWSSIKVYLQVNFLFCFVNRIGDQIILWMHLSCETWAFHGDKRWWMMSSYAQQVFLLQVSAAVFFFIWSFQSKVHMPFPFVMDRVISQTKIFIFCLEKDITVNDEGIAGLYGGASSRERNRLAFSPVICTHVS